MVVVLRDPAVLETGTMVEEELTKEGVALVDEKAAMVGLNDDSPVAIVAGLVRPPPEVPGVITELAGRPFMESRFESDGTTAVADSRSLSKIADRSARFHTADTAIATILTSKAT